MEDALLNVLFDMRELRPHPMMISEEAVMVEPTKHTVGSVDREVFGPSGCFSPHEFTVFWSLNE